MQSGSHHLGDQQSDLPLSATHSPPSITVEKILGGKYSSSASLLVACQQHNNPLNHSLVAKASSILLLVRAISMAPPLQLGPGNNKRERHHSYCH